MLLPLVTRLAFVNWRGILGRLEHAVGAGTVLRPGAPAAARLLDRLSPVAKRAGGPISHRQGVAKRFRPASTTFVSANTSGGHSRSRSVIGAPLAAHQVDASVGSPTPS